jgi:hypothetical protein
MDTQNSAVADVPNLKLARVGNKREKKRGGALFGGRGADLGAKLFGAGNMGGAAATSGFWAPGMSLAKMLVILLVSGGLSAGAWEIGQLLANSSASAPKIGAPKLFADKDAKYADTSGVIKDKRDIPNSLGYINNDGLTDEQRAAKKAAEEEAARKAASDAQAKADADAKAKADADKVAAAQVPAAPPVAAATPDMMKKALAGGGKFGSMSSGFGGGGGGGLSGGAGLSGGINNKFGAMNNMKGQNGALAGFGTGSKPTMSAAQKATPTPKSGLKGFAAQQLGNAFGATKSALASGQTESAAAGAGAPFDNNPAAGSVISGPGVSNGAQTGAADSAGSPNSSSNSGGPISSGGGAACSQSGYEPDINGNCQPVATPTMVNDAAYQGLIDAAMVILGIIMVLTAIAMLVQNLTFYGKSLANILCGVVVGLGAILVGLGATIAMMKHGDFMIGAIIGAVGGYIALTTYPKVNSNTAATQVSDVSTLAAHELIAASLGELAAASTKVSSLT